jgi:hypothetical protein
MRSILLIATIILLSGCEVLKGKREVRTDSTSVVKKDSGSVSVKTTNIMDSLAWWREQWNFDRDTTIVTGVTNVYPTSYIREGGVRTVEVQQVNYDSIYKSIADSTRLLKEEIEKSKQTSVGVQWYIWVMLGLVALIAMKILLPFKISMK